MEKQQIEHDFDKWLSREPSNAYMICKKLISCGKCYEPKMKVKESVDIFSTLDLKRLVVTSHHAKRFAPKESGQAANLKELIDIAEKEIKRRERICKRHEKGL